MPITSSSAPCHDANRCVLQQTSHLLIPTNRLYPTHIPLHPLQRGAVALGAALGALLKCAPTTLQHHVASVSPPPPHHSPARADLVAALGETTGYAALVNMRDRMRASASGREVLRDRPRVTVR